MSGPRQNRTITAFFILLRGTRILIALVTLAVIIALASWLSGRSGGG